MGNYLKERYERFEVEEELNNEIQELKSEIKQLKSRNAKLKKQNAHFKSSKPYKLWKLYGNINDDITDEIDSQIPNLKDIKVALISDQFTYDSFKYEFKAISLHPKTWKRQFIKEKPDIFFCESTWYGHDYKGNKGPWENKIGKLKGSDNENRTILFEILEYCRKHSIPTIFWNKEDPTHYHEDYLSFPDTAKEFDYIFTSAKECIEWYKKDFNHENVNFLMFAGQPKLFNPLRFNDEEIDEIVFAGTYYDNNPERTKLMDDIFDRLIENSQELLIYDRCFDLPNNDYPERFQKYVNPSLLFIQIPSVYKKMKWGLNFNIVTDSETMFARRIYELALSNVNILTNYSKAVEILFGDNVFVFDRDEELPDFNEDYEEKRMNNLYNVLENHTYTIRWKQILDTIGFEYVEDEKDITVIFKLDDLDELDSIIDKFGQISYDDKVLKIIAGKDIDTTQIIDKYPVIDSVYVNGDMESVKKDIDTEYWIIADCDMEPDFIKKAILHYQYLNKKVAIAEGSDKFSLDVCRSVENKIIHRCNANYLTKNEAEIEVYYI